MQTEKHQNGTGNTTRTQGGSPPGRARIAWRVAVCLLVAAGLLCFPKTGLATSISCGQTVVNTTTSNSQMDEYTFAGTAGQMLSFALYGPITCNFGGYAFNADIYNPSGQLVATVVSPCNSGTALNMTLTNSGIYTLLVHEHIYGSTGSYALSIQSMTGGGCNGTPIACGQTVEP